MSPPCPVRQTAATCSTRPIPLRGSTVSLRSTDGETWEPLETGLPSDLYIVAIEEGPAGYLLVGGQGAETNPTLWLSSDALTWELVHEFSQDQQYVQLTDGDGGVEGYVVVGHRTEKDAPSYERFALASADGRHWAETAAPFGPDDQQYQWQVAVSSHGGGWLATLGHRDERDLAVVLGRWPGVVGNGKSRHAPNCPCPARAFSRRSATS